MDSEDMKNQVKENLRLETKDHDLTISDIIVEVHSYCNLCSDHIPDALEPFIRKKVKGIIDYESVRGVGFTPEVASIKEGDGSITWAQTEGNTKASIYELTESDRKILRRFRRLRGYV